MNIIPVYPENYKTMEDSVNDKKTSDLLYFRDLNMTFIDDHQGAKVQNLGPGSYNTDSKYAISEQNKSHNFFAQKSDRLTSPMQQLVMCFLFDASITIYKTPIVI